MYACYSSSGNVNKDVEIEPALVIIPKGPDQTTWIGEDGRRYTITWGDPLYLKIDPEEETNSSNIQSE